MKARFHFRCPDCGGLASTFAAPDDPDPLFPTLPIGRPECGPCGGRLMVPFEIRDVGTEREREDRGAAALCRFEPMLEAMQQLSGRPDGFVPWREAVGDKRTMRALERAVLVRSSIDTTTDRGGWRLTEAGRAFAAERWPESPAVRGGEA